MAKLCPKKDWRKLSDLFARCPQIKSFWQRFLARVVLHVFVACFWVFSPFLSSCAASYSSSSLDSDCSRHLKGFLQFNRHGVKCNLKGSGKLILICTKTVSTFEISGSWGEILLPPSLWNVNTGKPEHQPRSSNSYFKEPTSVFGICWGFNWTRTKENIC